MVDQVYISFNNTGGNYVMCGVFTQQIIPLKFFGLPMNQTTYKV